MKFIVFRSTHQPIAAVALGLAAVYSSGVAGDPGSLAGLWRTPVDPASGESSVVELYRSGAGLSGRIVQIQNRQGQPVHRVCERCPGEMKQRAIAGLVFIEGLVQDGERWVDGRVVDLRPGLTQGMRGTVEIQREGDTAVVHGYKGFRALGETSVWSKIR